MNYAPALRVYGTSWLWIALALAGLYNICCKYRFAGWLLYFAASVLAVGTVPTNVLALAAAACYAVPWMMEKFWKDWRFYLVFVVIMLAMIVFYAPILPQLAAAAQLGEGFSSRMGAAAVTLGMYVACFGLLLFFAVLPGGIKPRGYYVRYLAWVLPLGAIFVLHRAPFPRVFVTMLPVLVMLVADGIDALTREKWSNFQKTVFYLTILSAQILLIPGGYLAAERAAQAGLKTLLFERRALGGVCLNEGCVPSKALLNSAKTFDHAKHAAAYGVTCSDVKIDQAAVIARKAKVVRTLVSGVFEHGPELDNYISRCAVGWNFSRISRVAASIMRVAMYEVLYMPDIPNAAAINEAVEIAKSYETPETVSFINGILGTFVRSQLPDNN
jgi:transcription antitermination factor NusB